MWLLQREFPAYPLHKIARFGNGKNAEDARNAIAAIDVLVACDPTAAAQIEAIVPELGGYDAQAARRATQNAWIKNRDYNLLAATRKAEADALPPRKKPADRQCLVCRDRFLSTWCGNRICNKCARD